MSEPFIGMIAIYGFNFAPRGWATCSGQLLPIAQNTALFSLLGTTYGGNGQTTFALPDLRGRVPNSAGQGPGLSSYDLGQVGGSESETLTISNLPAHGHVVATPCNTEDSTATNPAGNFLASTSSNIYNSAATASASMSNYPTANAGGSQPFSILQPYLTVNFCIALEGIFPSRN